MGAYHHRPASQVLIDLSGHIHIAGFEHPKRLGIVHQRPEGIGYITAP